jgi:hypothetical protein
MGKLLFPAMGSLKLREGVTPHHARRRAVVNGAHTKDVSPPCGLPSLTRLFPRCARVLHFSRLPAFPKRLSRAQEQTADFRGINGRLPAIAGPLHLFPLALATSAARREGRSA